MGLAITVRLLVAEEAQQTRWRHVNWAILDKQPYGVQKDAWAATWALYGVVVLAASRRGSRIPNGRTALGSAGLGTSAGIFAYAVCLSLGYYDYQDVKMVQRGPDTSRDEDSEP
ncbi:MAG: hypothetical protein M1827_000620 [Pycnora praestabilis]|nr:MAG: hypothetical protein M1827_000620 [Pycnora praestabilis]